MDFGSPKVSQLGAEISQKDGVKKMRGTDEEGSGEDLIRRWIVGCYGWSAQQPWENVSTQWLRCFGPKKTPGGSC